MQEHFDFDFVISYAGEDTKIAENLKTLLTERGARVFFAPDFQAQIWGENLHEYLSQIYSKKGRFCIIIISENYVKKYWTRHEWKSAQERMLTEFNLTYVLPIRLDDTELPGFFKTTAYMDVRNQSTNDIVDIALKKLDLSKHGSLSALSNNRVENFSYLREPDSRNAFLIRNSYLNRHANDFAINQWTNNLVMDSERPASSFVTWVAVPFPNPLTSDLLLLKDILKFDSSPYGLNTQTGNDYATWFSTAGLSGKRPMQTEYIRYAHGYAGEGNTDFRTRKFLRLTEEGAIEYAVGFPAVYPLDSIMCFNFIYLIGTTWKYMNLIAFLYKELGYEGAFQLIVNLKGTEGTAIAVFAKHKNERGGWLGRFDGEAFNRMGYITRGDGIAIDSNLQFTYQIKPKIADQTNQVAEALINDLSKRLQYIYKYEYADRHYIPDSKEFPWRQYEQYENLT
jgi:GR25 family glycosyltransferase involved in LPS biosynthesis